MAKTGLKQRTVQYVYVISLQKCVENDEGDMAKEIFLHNPFLASWRAGRGQIRPKLGPEQLQNAL